MKWAHDTGGRSLLLVQSATRVALSHFSRLQDDPSRLEGVLKRYIYASVVLLGLWFCVLSVAGQDLIMAIYTEKWLLPGVPRVSCAGCDPGRYGALQCVGAAGSGAAPLCHGHDVRAGGSHAASRDPSYPGAGRPGAPLGELIAFAIVIPFLVWAIPRHFSPAAEPPRPPAFTSGFVTGRRQSGGGSGDFHTSERAVDGGASRPQCTWRELAHRTALAPHLCPRGDCARAGNPQPPCQEPAVRWNLS